MEDIFITLMRTGRRSRENCIKQIYGVLTSHAKLLQQCIEANDSWGVIIHLADLDTYRQHLKEVIMYKETPEEITA